MAYTYFDHQSVLLLQHFIHLQFFALSLVITQPHASLCYMYVVLTKYLFAVHDTALNFHSFKLMFICNIAIGVIHHSADLIVLDVTANTHTNAEMFRTKSTCYVFLAEIITIFILFAYRSFACNLNNTCNMIC